MQAPKLRDDAKLERRQDANAAHVAHVDVELPVMFGLTEQPSRWQIGGENRDYRVGVYPKDPYWAGGFRDNGFAPQFRDGSNQVRHFVAYLAFGEAMGSILSEGYLRSQDPNYGATKPDYQLGIAAINLSGSLMWVAGDSVADVVSKSICE